MHFVRRKVFYPTDNIDDGRGVGGACCLCRSTWLHHHAHMVMTTHDNPLHEYIPFVFGVSFEIMLSLIVYIAWVSCINCLRFKMILCDGCSLSQKKNSMINR